MIKSSSPSVNHNHHPQPSNSSGTSSTITHQVIHLWRRPGFHFLPEHRGPLIPNDLHGTPKRRAQGDGTALVLQFHLPRASYATMAMRELMKMGAVESVMAYPS